MAVTSSSDLAFHPTVQSSTFKKTVIASVDFPAQTDILLAPANPNRLGLIIYNNSTSSMYVLVGTPGALGNQIGQCSSNSGPGAHYYMTGTLVYTGAIYVRRNAGTGAAWIIEFEK